MTITKEIPAAQLHELDMHEGDSLRVISEKGATVLVQIVQASATRQSMPSTAPGDWAREFLGAAVLDQGETTDDVRLAHLREKYGI